jgi:hypothetical protein
MFALEIFRYASRYRLDLPFLDAVPHLMLCISAVYFLMTASNMDFLMTVIGALGVTVMCSIFGKGPF